MTHTGAKATQSPSHTPEGIFVIHLRSDSDVTRQQLIGRVEHVKSGATQPFAALDALLAFMAQHAPSETESSVEAPRTLRESNEEERS